MILLDYNFYNKGVIVLGNNIDDKESKGITILDLLRAVKRNWIVMLCVVLVCSIVGVVYAKVGLHDKYKATSTLVIQIPYEDTNNSTDLSNSIRYVYTVNDLITDESTAKAAALKYNEDNEDKVTYKYILNHLSTSFTEYSLYLKINITDSDKERAVELVNDVTEVIISMQNDSDDTTTDDLLCTITQYNKPLDASDTKVVSPNRMLYAIVFFLLGFVIACVYAFLREFASTKYKTKEEIEALHYPIIGLQFDDKAKEKGNVDVLALNTVNAMDPYNKIINGIKYSNFNTMVKSVMITSTGMGELKSTVASNVACACAYNKAKVVLIDLDIRRPRLHKIFNLSRRDGLVEYLDGELAMEDLIKHTNRGVDVITVGKEIANPIVILESEKLKDLIEELKTMYDYVLIDTPPLLACGDALIISKMCDGVVYNIAMNNVGKKDIRDSIKSLEEVNAKILGINITKYKATSKSEYYYSNHYYSDDNNEIEETN